MCVCVCVCVCVRERERERERIALSRKNQRSQVTEPVLVYVGKRVSFTLAGEFPTHLAG